MCGRFTLTRLADLNLTFPWIKPPPDDWAAHYNIAPSQMVLAARNVPEPRFEPLLWGLVPSWAKDRSIGNRMINARCETLDTKPAFRTALHKRRCIIPAHGFYEWRKEPDGSKTPVYIHQKSGRPLALAGLWESWHDPENSEVISCTIVTCPPNELVALIHDRMPVILSPEDAKLWLEPGEVQGGEVLGLLKPCPVQELESYPVSRRVNSPREDSPQLLEKAQDRGLFA